MTNHRLRAFAAAALALLFTGCEISDGWGPLDRFRQEFRDEVALQPGGRLEVESTNGSIDVLVWDKNRAEISGVKYAVSEELLRSVKIEIQPNGNNLRVRALVPEGRKGYGVKFELRVPPMTLDTLRTSNGGVTLDGLAGGGRIVTSNGSVKVTKLTGDLSVNTSNARIELAKVSGRLRLDTSNGSIRVSDAEGDLMADTSNARIEVELRRATPGSTIHLDSSNGSIDFELAEHNANPIILDTSNSSIKVRLPASINGRLNAKTSNGSISNDFQRYGTDVKTSKARHEMTLGSGGPLLDISTSNGSIDIIRR
jgi:DUF4097 and DUF4098 domain-containing protein YvlB